MTSSPLTLLPLLTLQLARVAKTALKTKLLQSSRASDMSPLEMLSPP